MQAIIIETGSFKNFLIGHEPACAYDNWISHEAEGIANPGYNAYALWDRQTNGFGDFQVPTTQMQTNWATIIDSFIAEDWNGTQNLIDSFGYPFQVVRFNDTDMGRSYYLIRETLNTDYDDNGTADPYDDDSGAFEWGWGMFIYNPSSNRPIIITTPHPCDDFISEILSYDAFTTWNARYWLLAGAGREVRWSNVGTYDNSKSISDPTRYALHPFNTVYKKFADKIRLVFNKREMSVQMHSYDWNQHDGYPSVQISPGYQRYCANLPLRDLSRFKHDLINLGAPIMIPANTIGTHTAVGLNQYYGVLSFVHPYTYVNADTTIAVNTNIDLWAYSQNSQMLYTLNGWNDYDVYEPFLHLEMDELPNCYTYNDNTYKWYYGWNQNLQKWDVDIRFNNARAYFGRVINDLELIWDEVFAMNDQSAPLPPSNLVAFSPNFDYITLQWTKADDYDFDSYEILYYTSPIDSIFNIYNRSNDSFLASPGCEQINLSGLQSNTVYYFKIRAVDKNGNRSELSNQVMAITGPSKINNFRAIGRDSFVQLKWVQQNQSGNLGFNVYRQNQDGDYNMVDTYVNNPLLLTSVGSNFVWNDINVVNDTAYTYKISAVNNQLMEFYHNFVSTATPKDYFKLYVTKEDGSLRDSLVFAINPGASNGNDNDYDVNKSAVPSSNFVWGAWWEQYWGNNGTYLQQEVHGDIDVNQTYQMWYIRLKTDQANQNLVLSVDSTFARYSEKLYLYDNATGSFTNLMAGNYTFTIADNNYRNMRLYWGNLQPVVSVTLMPNRIFKGGTSITFPWSAQFNFLVDHYNVFIQNDTDSLFVMADLPYNTNSQAFTFPLNTDMPNSRFVVDAWGTDGQLIRKYSSYRFGIVPNINVIAPLPGMWTQTNIWPNNPVLFPQVFGTGATGWTYRPDTEYAEADTFKFGLGYWVNKANPFEYISGNTVKRDSLSFPLLTGWNLLPNPHVCNYYLKDFRFRVNGIVFTYNEMMEQRLISPCLFAYRDGKYVQTSVVYPYEAFLLKYYGGANLTTTITFIPYNIGSVIDPPPYNWKLGLTAAQQDCDADGFIIGTHPLATNGYEFKFDLPEPPAKPLDSQVRMYLYHSSHTDSTFWDFLLNQEIKSPLSGSTDETKTWNFRLELQDINPVTFSFDTSQFPPQYSAILYIGDWHYSIQYGNTCTFIPPYVDTFTGQMQISNHVIGNEDATLPAISRLTGYPNPFNPVVTIAFTLGKQTDVKVDIYNIKGQHVKRLQNGLLKSGNQQLVWDGTDASNKPVGTGIYFVRVKTPVKAQTLKLMLLK